MGVFIEVLDTLRSRPLRGGRRIVFTDADRDRIAALAERARAGETSREANDRAVDVLERELEPFVVDPA